MHINVHINYYSYKKQNVCFCSLNVIKQEYISAKMIVFTFLCSISITLSIARIVGVLHCIIIWLFDVRELVGLLRMNGEEGRQQEVQHVVKTWLTN